MDSEKLKYPIGKYEVPVEISPILLRDWIAEISILPQLLRDVVESLTEEQLDTPYRSGGWTVRQVIHHLPDSHLNAYIRFKLALTEENPSIRPYYEDRWAELESSKNAPIEDSLLLLEALHKRWVTLLNDCSKEDLERTFFHPESKHVSTLIYNVGNYAWHGNHHLAQITGLKMRMVW